jgi:Terminase RNaseH-like domain
MPTIDQHLRAATRTLEGFSRIAAPRYLRPYQLEAGNAIINSVIQGKGHTFTMLMARQSGKNELAAQVEAFLLNLYSGRGGAIVKAAPSYRPQIKNSELRLREILDLPFLAGQWTSSDHVIQMGKARLMFFSAAPGANVVGATASLLLAIDEAQDVDEDVYNRSFKPMASTTRATTVLYGTAWDDDNILEQQRRYNRRIEEETGEKLNFFNPWTDLAALEKRYDESVRAEIDRLGLDHPAIKTQYLLETVPGVGRLFSAEVIERMHGSHDRHLGPNPYATYVAGIDVAGEVSELSLSSERRVLNDKDETVITIAEVVHDDGWDSDGRKTVKVVEILRWKGVTYDEQYRRILQLLRDQWSVGHITVDATGVGAGLASFLVSAMPKRVEPFTFTAATKSSLGFNLLAAAETGRLSIHRQETEASRELWRQLSHVRYALRGSERLEFAVPTSKGHDDCVMSLALAVHAAASSKPPPYGGINRGIDTDPAAGMEEHFWGRESRAGLW